MEIAIYVDGLAEPSNPGTGTWAWIIFDESGDELAQAYGVLPSKVSNNYSEYCGAGFALKYLREHHADDGIAFYSDSQLVLNQIQGTWQCNAETLIPLRDRCRELLADLSISFHWIPSEQNKADELTRLAYQEKTGVYPVKRLKASRGARVE